MDGDDDAPPGVPEWVVTYGDMMSLLLTFFIMLVSMSELKEEGKLRALLTALNERFGPVAAVSAAPGAAPATRNAKPATDAAGASGIEGGGRTRAASAGRGGRFAGAPESPPDPPALAGPAAFGRFSAALEPTAGPTLDALAAAVTRTGGPVVVRGHASPEIPPAGAPDAWTLARARAEAVADALAERGVERGRFRVEAAGPTEPPPGWGSPGVGPRAWDRVDVLLSAN